MIQEVEIPKFPDQPTVVWGGVRLEQDSVEVSSLKERFPGLPIAILEEDISWQMTGDEESDKKTNAMIWEQLAADSFGGGRAIIAGVFPPVAIEALSVADFSHCVGPDVYTPVYNDQDPTHPVRWVKLAGMA